jgi:hypothetical protein
MLVNVSHAFSPCLFSLQNLTKINPGTAWSRKNSGAQRDIGRLMITLVAMLLMVAGLSLPSLAQQVETTVPSSQRVTIDLSAGVPNFVENVNATNPTAAQSAWWYQDTNTSTSYSSKTFNESTDTAATWIQVGVPYDANIYRSFLNQQSGGGDGSLNGGNNWYRLHFKVDPSYSAASGKKIMVEFEGAQVGLKSI